MDAISLSATNAAGFTLPDDPSLIAGVVLLDPIVAPADSVAVVPPNIDVAIYVAPAEDLPAISGPPAFEVKAISIGGIVFDLSDGYALFVDESNSAIYVTNEATGESIAVWGSARIALDGADAARFWGTTTVELANGTKITLETKADADLVDLYRLDRLTVTQGARAMVITGVSEETLGDLAVEQSFRGEDIDEDTRDGLVLIREQAGWRDEYGNAVDREVLNQTRPGRLYGPGRTTLSLGEIVRDVSRAVSYDQVSSLMLTMNRNLSTDVGGRDAKIDLRRALALYAGEVARLPLV